MLDLELLKTLVCVVEERSFTRAADRVHRTQSTVSQQVRKLEEAVGHPLLTRDRTGKNVSPTEQGELLAGYARRLLALAQEAEDRLARPAALAPVRLGVPEDFDAGRMSAILQGFAGEVPGARLDTVSGMSTDLQALLRSGEVDLALVKREPGSGPAIASWPEAPVWVAGARAKVDDAVVPLALFPPGCVYRQRALRVLDESGRRWRVAFGSHSLTGIQAAVASGLGITVLPSTAVLPGHRVLRKAEGFPPLPATELALVRSPLPLNATQRALADYLVRAISPPKSKRASKRTRSAH